MCLIEGVICCDECQWEVEPKDLHKNQSKYDYCPDCAQDYDAKPVNKDETP